MTGHRKTAEPLALHPRVLMLGPNAETGTLDADGEFVPTSVSKLPPTHARVRRSGKWPEAEAQPPVELVRKDGS